MSCEVRRRARDLAPGGGFVFNPVHNIQAGVPITNVGGVTFAVGIFQEAGLGPDTVDQLADLAGRVK
jgi:hypothetical protein